MNIPLPNKEAKTVAENLMYNWFWTFGVPENILSDQGKEFRSKLMDYICTTLDIGRLNTTAGHPECDGGSERNVQTIKAMIRAHVWEDQ